jgi:phosphoglycerol transferase MdoB-like AlkP superfamily enzyme
MNMIFVSIMIIIHGAVLTLSNEITVRQGKGVLVYVIKNFLFFLCNVFIHAGISLLLLGISGNMFFTCVFVFFVFTALSNVSFFKYAARNEVLYAYDFLLFFKVMSVSDRSNYYFTRYNAAALCINVLCVCAVALTPFSTIDALQRVIAAVAGLVFFLWLFLYLRKKQTQKKAVDEGEDFIYFTKGFSLGLLSNIYLYFNEDINKTVNTPGSVFLYATASQSDIAPTISPAKPNIIAVLSESFWDMGKLPGLNFSEPLTPHFRTLYEDCAHGSLVVTPFGGGTCNVESEILTGVPIRHYNLSNSFYHRYITRPMQSLATIFKENGYETIALHTFDKNFYNRANALAHMGFDRFIAKEDLANPVYEGLYIADSELTNMIVKAFDERTKPIFILAISMENHQPYNRKKYAHHKIKLLNGNIPPRLKETAEAYAHGLNDADRELAVLTEHFKQKKEPVEIVFFGDHLGALGPLFELYRKTGYVSSGELTLEDIKNLYSTEFLIWANYTKSKERYMNTSSNFFGNIILNSAGPEIKKPDMYRFLDEIYKEWHSVNRNNLFIDAFGKMYGSMPDAFRSIDEEYKRIFKETQLWID